MPKGSLVQYRKKRDFSHTPEPRAEMGEGPGGRFVVHEHHATQLHYDLRIEMDGVLKSFAVPKGPSLDPEVRRLAVETEDHPVKYLEFQGSIADGNYGAGQMVIWDRGTYRVPTGEDPLEAYRQGKVHLEFHGEKLRGVFMLIHGTHGDRQWLLFKKHDEDAKPGWETPRILPYGSRSERPQGFEIPKSALRKVKDWTPAPDRKDPVRGVRGGARKTAKSEAETMGKRAPGAKGPWPAGAKKSPLPVFVEPMLATLADEPFDHPDWVFESKFDGWRALAHVDANSLHLISRNRHSLDDMFPELLGRDSLKAKSCLIDGEIVALDGRGMPRFQLLQNRLKGKSGNGAGSIVYYAFDLLHLDGQDLTGCSLLERKALLKRILPEGGAWRYSEHFARDGKEIFRKTVKLGLEGVVAKRSDSTYRSGRSDDWLKIKSKLRQEVVIGGYTEPRRSRILFGSLVAGLYSGGEFRFAGHVGGGFNAKLLKEVYGFMRPLETSKCPFAEVPKTNEKVQWIRPKLVAEVEFAEWTEDGRMRQPIFMGLRPDKDPKACMREIARPTGEAVAEAEAEAGGNAPDTPEITHPDKIYWPRDGYTKGDLIAYYGAVSKWILPHLKDRPLILKRFPNGIGKPAFFQHDVKSAPSFVTRAPLKEEDGGLVHYALCQNRESLLWLANMGVIPQNPWLARLPHTDRPDYAVFDLDPQDSVPFPEVCSSALFIKEVLDGLGLSAWVKTSGSRGIHIYVPLKPRYDFTQSLAFAELVGAYAAKLKPDTFTVERSIKARPKGRIYLDCMQNSRAKSVASVYSAREKPGAPVSTALEWGELKKKFAMEDFNIKTMPKRLERKGDLFAEVLKQGNAMDGALKKLNKIL